MAGEFGLKTKPVSRRARFKSVVTLIIDGKIKMFEGTLEGEIAREKSGNGGFGYDPIFIADEYPGLTLADISEEEKNAISHRGKALRAMAQWLNSVTPSEVEESPSGAETRLQKALVRSVTPAAALAYMVFILLYFPCIATFVAIKNESGEWKWAIITAVYTILLAWVAAFITFRIASLFL